LKSGFYYVHFDDHPGNPVAHGIDDPAGDRVLAEPTEVINWQGIDLELKTDTPPDYLANDLGLRLCSEKARSVIDGELSAADEVEWLHAGVTDGSGRTHQFFILHFRSYPEVLDWERSITVGNDFIVKPVLSESKARLFHVFSIPGGAPRLIVSDAVRQKLQESSCTGMAFARVAMSPGDG
jgi:hypothetical protein